MLKARRRSLVITALCAVVPATGASSAAGAETKRLSASSLLSEINKARAANGVTPLTRSGVLTRPARNHSNYLASTGKLTHIGSDGKPFYSRLYAAGYPRNRAVAENLASSGGCGTNVAGQIVQMWLQSPGHRRNLLSRRYSKIGVAAVADAGCARTVFTADFGG